MRKEKTIDEDYGDVMIYGWSDLHQPLLELILKHLPLPDRRRFSSVCRSWHAAEKQSLHPPLPQLPWIMLQHSRETHRFFSLSENRVYEIKLPRMDNTSYLAACGGWLLERDDNSGEHFLINPISKERMRLPHFKGFYDDCVLTSPPTNPNCLVLFHCRRSESLQILHLERDSTWRGYSLMNFRCYSLTFIYFEGKLYSLDHGRKLMVIDLLPYPKGRLVELDGGLTPPLKNRWQEVLVESSGEILLVIATTLQDKYVKFPQCLYWFEVFKVDWDVMAWVKVQSLGDQILFLSDGVSISVSAATTGGKGNRIYYIPSVSDYFFEFDLGSGIPVACSIPEPHYTIEALLANTHVI